MRIGFKVIALIPCLALLPLLAATLGAVPPAALPAGAPTSVRVVGDTAKVCQLTGEKDWESGRPTAARTFSRFGLDATDLGYPVEHHGKLILLFGDSWPPPHGGGPAGEVVPDDAVGVTTRRAPPTSEDGRCLELEIHHTPARKFAPATVVGPVRVKQGFFNVPSGGVSVESALYAFFWTDHCSAPNPLGPSPDDPLARPRPQPHRDCPETDDRNSIGRSVLARSDDDGRTFSHVVAMPTGFVYATAVNAMPQADLPADQRLGVFVFAAPRYRASVPYLAVAPVESFADTATWRFFTGLGPGGQPIWVGREEWNRGRPAAASVSRPPWNPPGEPELFKPRAEIGRSVGELSVTWNRELHLWLMLYGGPGGMLVRVARAPWGPWSDPTRILGGEPWLGCRMVMTPNGCGNRRDYWAAKHENGKFVGGGLYAPFVLDRYSTPAGAGADGGRSCTIYWLVSTWNPYEVSVMRTTIRTELPPREPRPGVAGDGVRSSDPPVRYTAAKGLPEAIGNAWGPTAAGYIETIYGAKATKHRPLPALSDGPLGAIPRGGGAYDFYAINGGEASYRSRVKDGYSATTSSALIPSARLSRITDTMIRVPRMHGLPWQT